MSTLKGVIFLTTEKVLLLNTSTASSKQSKESGEQSMAHNIGQSVGQSVEQGKRTGCGNRGWGP